MDLFEASAAREARDEGIKKVLEPNDAWRINVDTMVRNIRNFEGTGEDLRALVSARFGEPHHVNAWGAMMYGFVRKNYLKPTGEWRQPKSKKSHARLQRVYRSLGLFRSKEDVIDAAAKRGYQLSRKDNYVWTEWERINEKDRAFWREIAKAILGDGE